ncbi:hypothetical protein ABQH43_06355 [Streptococcus sp. ZJ100]
MGNLFDDLGKNLGDFANNVVKETGKTLDNSGKALSDVTKQASKAVGDVVSEAGKVAGGAVSQVVKVAEDVGDTLFNQTVEIEEEFELLDAPEEELLDLNTFELSLVPQKELTIDVTKKELYNYDFGSYALAPLQEVASQMTVTKAVTKLPSLVEQAHKLISKQDAEYVATFSKEARKKLDSGEWSWGLKKQTREMYGVLRDSKSGQIQEMVGLEKRSLEQLGVSPELMAMQVALESIMEQIEHLNKLMERIEQGQYNDRYAGFFSARQLVVEALAMNDEESQKNLLLSAVKISNETIAKLMLSIHQDAHDFIDPTTNRADAMRIDHFLQNSIGYLNSSVQLNVVAYTALGEKDALLGALVNYQSFMEQTLLSQTQYGHSLAWSLDNFRSGNDGNISRVTMTVTTKIERLVQATKRLSVLEGENNE